MASIPLKPEYGPTLGQLLAPRWARASHLARAAAVLACVAVVVAVVAAALTFKNSVVSFGGPTPFSFEYRGLYRVAPDPGGYVKVQRRSDGVLRDSFAVGPLRLPPYRGSLTGELPLYVWSYTRRLAARYGPGFELEGEGRARVNSTLGSGTMMGYNVFFRAVVAGHRMYGRDVLLFGEQPGVRQGLDILMLTSPTSSPQVTAPVLVGNGGVLKLAIQTFKLE